MYRRNNRGPSTEPCGTPERTLNVFERRPFTETSEVRSFSQLFIQSQMAVLSWLERSLLMSRLCGTLSNALAKSRKIQKAVFFFSKVLIILLQISFTASSVDLLA